MRITSTLTGIQMSIECAIGYHSFVGHVIGNDGKCGDYWSCLWCSKLWTKEPRFYSGLKVLSTPSWIGPKDE